MDRCRQCGQGLAPRLPTWSQPEPGLVFKLLLGPRHRDRHTDTETETDGETGREKQGEAGRLPLS